MLNHRTAPALPTVWAVRMSMGCPFAWQEVVWKPEWGTYRRRDLTGHRVVDGGLLSNFPIHLFVSSDENIDEIMGEGSQTEDVIGLLIDETLEVPGAGESASQGRLCSRPARPGRPDGSDGGAHPRPGGDGALCPRQDHANHVQGHDLSPACQGDWHDGVRYGPPAQGGGAPRRRSCHGCILRTRRSSVIASQKTGNKTGASAVLDFIRSQQKDKHVNEDCDENSTDR